MAQLLALSLLSIVPFLLLHDLANEIRKDALTNRERKQSGGDLPFRERLFLIGYADQCKAAHHRKMQYCCMLNKILLLFFALLPLIMLCCYFFATIRTYVKTALICKTLLLDCPFLLFALLNSRHLKNGGVGWRL